MELNQLRYFQTVARFQQMTKAAEELHISQSSLSKTISMLERDVGAKLFDRLGNRIILNRTGQAFLSRVNRALLELEDAVREADASDCGAIHFAASIPGLCTSYLDAFLQNCPQVMLRQSIMGPEEMTAAVHYGTGGDDGGAGKRRTGLRADLFGHFLGTNYLRGTGAGGNADAGVPQPPFGGL